MDAALRRRAYVLQRMADEGYITAEQAETAKQTTIALRGQPQQPRSAAPFFVEEVRKYLERQYGAKALYESGLSVTTTLDAALQDAANTCGARRAAQPRQAPRLPQAATQHRRRRQGDQQVQGRAMVAAMAAGDIVPALVVDVKPAPANTARVTIGRYHADLGRDGVRVVAAPSVCRRLQAGGCHRGGNPHARRSNAAPPRSRSSRRRSSKGRSSRSTTGRARSRPWSADGTSRAASSIAPFRRTGSWARRSSRLSTPRRSIAGLRRPR